ncbi:MAG: MFS transporter [Aeromicrobium sp.]|uniref:MFS transporter n=1 Tax=Aeromicrobium sp. TaxID=1871063 RepID=UPI0039E37CBC
MSLDLMTRRATRRDWAALVVLMLPVLLVSVDNTVLSFALPEISSGLAPTGAQLLWIVDVYPLMLAGLLIAMGSLGDRLGRRRLLVTGATGFGVVSLMAAFSPGAETLIALRALQGFFGAMLMPSTLSIIRNVFADANERRLAIAVWAAMFSGGAALGPVLGGWLLQHFWWGSVLLINVPVVALFVPLALLFVPESRDPRPGPVDPASIALSLVTMLPAVYGIKHLAHAGVDDVTAACFAAAGLFGTLFVRRQARSATPMLDVGLFRDRVFAGSVVANLLSLMALTGFLFFGAQILQLVIGLDPVASALVLVPGLIATVAAGFAAVALVRRFPARVLVTSSFAASAVGYALVAFAGTPTVASVLIAFVVMGAGIGMAETLTNDLVLSHAPAHRAGAASAISETAYEIGAVLGTAVLGSVVTATYRSQLGEGHETLGATLEHAATLPDHVGAALAESAKAAFGLGVQYSAGVAILVALAAALISWRTLPDHSPTGR